MLVRHDTSLLEQAVDLAVKRAAIPTLQAEAAAQERVARAAAFRRLATGAAISVAALGIGLGIMFGFWRSDGTPGERQSTATPVPSSDQVSSAVPTPEPAPRAPSTFPDLNGSTSDPLGSSRSIAPSASTDPSEPTSSGIPDVSDQPPAQVTTDYTKFRTVVYEMGGRSWGLEAGHHFDSDEDETWRQAWCYTRQEVDGVLVTIDLAERLPGAAPVGPVASRATLQRVGLDDSSAIELARHCAWIDEQKFAASDFVPKTGRSSVAAPAVAQSDLAKDEFQTMPGWDAIGNDLPGMPYKDVSLDWCQSTCATNYQCLALTYNRRFKACFLKGDAVEAVPNEDAVMVVREVVAQSVKYVR